MSESKEKVDVDGETFEVFRDLLMAYEAQYIDWDKFNHGGPDYDPSYTPEFPDLIKRARRIFGRMSVTQWNTRAE